MRILQQLVNQPKEIFSQFLLYPVWELTEDDIHNAIFCLAAITKRLGTLPNIDPFTVIQNLFGANNIATYIGINLIQVNIKKWTFRVSFTLP